MDYSIKHKIPCNRTLCHCVSITFEYIGKVCVCSKLSDECSKNTDCCSDDKSVCRKKEGDSGSHMRCRTKCLQNDELCDSDDQCCPGTGICRAEYVPEEITHEKYTKTPKKYLHRNVEEKLVKRCRSKCRVNGELCENDAECCSKTSKTDGIVLLSFVPLVLVMMSWFESELCIVYIHKIVWFGVTVKRCVRHWTTGRLQMESFL